MKNNISTIICLIVLSAITVACSVTKSTIDMKGDWGFSLDERDRGEIENWAAGELQGSLSLPGSLQEQGYGHDIGVNTEWTGKVEDRSWYTDARYERYRQPGNIKVPFWLNPDKHYVRAAWYQKEIEVPAGWENRPVEIEFERAHWRTTLYVDGKKTGSRDALGTPQRYLLDGLGKGAHTITVRVDNRMNIDVGSNAHSVSDHTQSNWNGLTGNISISAKPNLFIDEVQIYPDIKSKNAKVEVKLNGTYSKATLKLQAFLNGKPAGVPTVMEVDATAAQGVAETIVEIGDEMLLWSEFSPNVYRMNVSLVTPEGKDEKSINFGFRDFKTNGTNFEINGRPIFLRGTLECCIFPMTGYPAMDTGYWEKIYAKCREFGLNHVRFHSWCPPRAAFDAADRMGIYLQAECGVWTNIGDGRSQDEWIREESDRILKEYGNHPSFCLLAHGNEPNGHNQVQYLHDLIAYWKEKDGRRLYTSSGGWPYVENADYFNSDHPRIGGNLDNAINTGRPSTDYDHESRLIKDMPMLSHEIGQWCVYPNFKEIDKYTGVLKAKNFEIFRETLDESGLGDLADEFLHASGRLQALCYKADIEAALRTKGQGGFQLLDLHDFPGQGTALVGVLDAFWDEKGYVDGEEFSRFCNRTVPLVRFPDLVCRSDQILKAPVEVANYGEKPISGAVISWKMETKAGELYRQGEWKADLPVDNGIAIGDIEVPLNGVTEPTQFKITVSVENTSFGNDWNVWVYPSEQPAVSEPYITYSLDQAAMDKLDSGENVLLLTKGNITPEKGGDIKVGFSPIFWNTAWTHNRPPHTLGIFCDATHPVFASFPNDGYSDYQWRDICMNCNAMVLDDFSKDFRPVIHLVDDWFHNRKLGILFETKAGNGKLMVCSVDIDNELDTRMGVAQFRQSLLEYMASENFDPKDEVDLAVVKSLLLN